MSNEPLDLFVGIDLGTTNSAVAFRNAYGRPEIIKNGTGANVTPSIIYFGSDPPAVGAEAREWGRVQHDLVASFFKPHMGSPHFRLEFGGRSYDAADLSAIVLRQLRQDAENALGGPVKKAVITVPAYFADAQRKATITAGEQAGLEILRLINEPTAAALAYGLQRDDIDETVLIYDLGGGTFDVTIARVAPDAITIQATAGDHDLGGKNWDDRIATFLSERFADDTGIDPLDDPMHLFEVLTLAERAKWALSERTQTRITLQLGPERRSYDLSREAFEAMSEPLLDRTLRLSEEALGAAGMNWDHLDGVLLVGGSTRMPMVRRFLKEMARKEPRGGVNVDEAVALGAAIQAAMDIGQSIGSAAVRFTLAGARRVQDVMSHSLGVIAVNEAGDTYINDIVISRNLPIPARSTKSYVHATHGGQNQRLEVYLTQGESSLPLDCTILGKYVFQGIQPTDAEVTVDVTLSYDMNGVVQVEAIQRDTRKALAMTIEPVPDDLSWLAGPPVASQFDQAAELLRIYLLIDVSASMTGEPLEEAQKAAREFLNSCDFTRAEVGLIAFSTEVILQAEATDNARRVQAAISRLEPQSSTNLTDALQMAAEHLVAADRTRYIIILTDGYPDAPESAVEAARTARDQGIEIVAIGTGEADRDYLQRLASTQAGTIFARSSELVRAFGHIAQVISSGGRSLRKLS